MDGLLRNWDIGKITAIESIHSYWNKTSLVKTVEGHSYILKEKSNFSQTEQESDLLFRLYESGAPVAVPIHTLDGKWYTWTEDRIFCLYPQLPGESFAEHYAGKATARAEAVGSAIGFLHACFLECDDLGGYSEINLIEQIRNWAIPCIREHGTILEADRLQNIWDEVELELKSIYPQLPKQLIHRDLHPGNILFEAERLTGFIDFEMVVRGPRIFDVCYRGTSLLVSGFPNAQKMQRWHALLRSLVKGYQRICPLTLVELSAIYGILTGIEFLFAAFSLEIQAESAAKCNADILQWLSANREVILAQCS